jgi:hypothetical protein
MPFELAPLRPLIGGVMMPDEGQKQAAGRPVDDQAKVRADPHRPEILVGGAVGNSGDTICFVRFEKRRGAKPAKDYDGVASVQLPSEKCAIRDTHHSRTSDRRGLIECAVTKIAEGECLP